MPIELMTDLKKSRLTDAWLSASRRIKAVSWLCHASAGYTTDIPGKRRLEIGIGDRTVTLLERSLAHLAGRSSCRGQLRSMAARLKMPSSKS